MTPLVRNYRLWRCIWFINVSTHYIIPSDVFVFAQKIVSRSNEILYRLSCLLSLPWKKKNHLTWHSQRINTRNVGWICSKSFVSLQVHLQNQYMWWWKYFVFHHHDVIHFDWTWSFWCLMFMLGCMDQWGINGHYFVKII